MKNLLLLALVLILSSCGKEEMNDRFVFGHFFGECHGESCVETYLFSDNMIYEDQNNDYSHDNFDFQLIDQEFIEIAAKLEKSIPEKLWKDSASTFGCPDCGDWGGLYVELTRDGITRFWRLDNMIESNPAYLQDFALKIRCTISVINGAESNCF